MAWIDEFIPPVCLACASFDSSVVESNGMGLCRGCRETMAFPRSIPFHKDVRVRLADKSVWIWDYERVKTIIHYLKFSSDYRWRRIVKTKLLEFVDGLPWWKEVKAITFVPMPFWKRLIFRPLNPSLWMARILGRYWNLPSWNLFTVKFWKPTIHKSKSEKERRERIRACFSLGKESRRLALLRPDEALLVVDDVLTSGSTLSTLCGLIRRRYYDFKIYTLTLCG